MSKRPIKGRWGKTGWEEHGGYMAARRQKLKDQFHNDRVNLENGLKSDIFKDVCIYVDGYTDPPVDKLRQYMIAHGGTFAQNNFRRKVTHVIATNLPHSKIAVLRKQKIILPQWIVDCVEANKLLPYQPYQLYTQVNAKQPAIKAFASSSAISTNISNSKTNQVEYVTVTELDENDDASATSTQSDADIFADETISQATESIIHHPVEATRPFSTKPSGDLENDGSQENLDLIKTDDEKTGLSLTKTSPSTSSSLNPLPNISTSSSASKPSHSGTKRAGEAGFLSQFYAKSRLHHLSWWAGELSLFVSELKAPGLSSLPSWLLTDEGEPGERVTLAGSERIVMHVDMDCFFVSVGLRSRPELRGKPVAVTHSKGRSAQVNPDANPAEEFRQYEIANGRPPSKQLASPKSEFRSMSEAASCSYEARKAGVRNGMLMGRAKELCPDLVTIPYDFEAYHQVSQDLYRIIVEMTHELEVVSCDEAFVDATSLLTAPTCLPFSPLMLAQRLRSEIFNRTGCPASVGIGSNPLMARLATRLAKPNGQFWLKGAEGQRLLAEMSVKDLPSVGGSTQSRLAEAMHVRTCGELAQVSLSLLQKEFGNKIGLNLYNMCRGKDDRQIKTEKERKSISAEINYGMRFTSENERDSFLTELSTELSSRCERIGVKGRTLTFKLMVRHPNAPKETAKFMGHGFCTHLTKSVTLPIATRDQRLIVQECLSIMRQWDTPYHEIRGMGIQMHRLENDNKPANRGQTMLLNFLKQQPQPSTKPQDFQPSTDASSTRADNEKSTFTSVKKDQHSPSTSSASSLKPNERLLVSDKISPCQNLFRKSHFMVDSSARQIVASRPKSTNLRIFPDALPPLPRPPPNASGNLSPSAPSSKRRTDNLLLTALSQIPGHSAHIPSSSPETVTIQTPSNDIAIEQLPSVEINNRPTVSTSISSERPIDIDMIDRPSTSRGHTSLPKPLLEIEELPSFSQVDQSVFSLLPPEIRQELESAYAKKRKVAEDEAKVKDVVDIIRRIPLHHQAVTAGKKAGISPFKRGRGRGRGSRRGNHLSGRGQMTLNFNQRRDKAAAVNPGLSSAGALTVVDDVSGVNEVCSRVPVIDKSSPDQLFVGKSLREVKDLLNAWISSEEVPLEEDAFYFSKFLVSLISKEMDLVHNCLLAFRRLVYHYPSTCDVNSSSAAITRRSEWERIYGLVEDQVQTKCRQLYGAVFKIPELA